MRTSVSDPALDLSEVLTVDQMAAFLQISRSSAYQAVRDGTIPSFRIGRSVRVSRAALLGWIGGQNNGSSRSLEVVDFSRSCSQRH